MIKGIIVMGYDYSSEAKDFSNAMTAAKNLLKEHGYDPDQYAVVSLAKGLVALSSSGLSEPLEQIAGALDTIAERFNSAPTGEEPDVESALQSFTTANLQTSAGVADTR
jgi:hypothetical protein